MEEIDPDEDCAMLEARAREENPEEKYQMETAWRLGSLRREIDKLEGFITELNCTIRQPKSVGQRQKKRDVALSQPTNHLENSERERQCQKREIQRQPQLRKLAREQRK